MAHIRLRWRKVGGHIHVGVWSGTERGTTHGRNGSLVFREHEWETFVAALRDGAGAGELSSVETLRESEFGE